MTTAPTLTRRLADEIAAEPTTRTIRLADGSTYSHEVGPLSWIDQTRLGRHA